MNDFDVVFLFLSQAKSRRFDLFLQLYEASVTAGFHTAMATHPNDLRKQGERLRIVVVDGDEEGGDFNPFQVTRDLSYPYKQNQRIVFVTDSMQEAFARGRDVGADVCV